MMPANEADIHQKLLIKGLIKTHRHCLIAHRIDQLDFDGRFGFAPLELFDEGEALPAFSPGFNSDGRRPIPAVAE